MLKRIFNGLRKIFQKSSKKQNDPDSIPTLPYVYKGPSFEEWIKESGFESKPYNEQQDLYAYFRMVDKVAETSSKTILPNPDVFHAAIVVSIIFDSAKKEIFLAMNTTSIEVLGQAICRGAIGRALDRGKRIKLHFHPAQPFIVMNDSGMVRREISNVTHSALVMFR